MNETAKVAMNLLEVMFGEARERTTFQVSTESGTVIVVELLVADGELTVWGVDRYQARASVVRRGGDDVSGMTAEGKEKKSINAALLAVPWDTLGLVMVTDGSRPTLRDRGDEG